jgi:hypothetical protein
MLVEPLDVEAAEAAVVADYTVPEEEVCDEHMLLSPVPTKYYTLLCPRCRCYRAVYKQLHSLSFGKGWSLQRLMKCIICGLDEVYTVK